MMNASYHLTRESSVLERGYNLFLVVDVEIVDLVVFDFSLTLSNAFGNNRFPIIILRTTTNQQKINKHKKQTNRL